MKPLGFTIENNIETDYALYYYIEIGRSGR